jgi:triphosphatase
VSAAGNEMVALVRLAPPAALVLSPDDGAALAARAVVRFHLRAFAAAEPHARAGEVEPVHQLRVATRRLRAALRLFAPLLPARFLERAHDDLAWVAGSIGAVRDLDVLTEAVKTRAARLDPELRSALGPVEAAIHDRRAVALAALVTTLDANRCQRLLDRLRAFAESSPRGGRDAPLGRLAPQLVRPLVRAVVRAGGRLSRESPPADFHRLRVRVKRLRYALEPLRAIAGKPVRRLGKLLEELQDVLGAAQDAATHIAWLRAHAGTPEVEPASLLPVGALIQVLAKRAAKQRRRALKAWRKLERSGLLDTIATELRARSPEPMAEVRAG